MPGLTGKSPLPGVPGEWQELEVRLTSSCGVWVDLIAYTHEHVLLETFRLRRLRFKIGGAYISFCTYSVLRCLFRFSCHGYRDIVRRICAFPRRPKHGQCA